MTLYFVGTFRVPGAASCVAPVCRPRLPTKVPHFSGARRNFTPSLFVPCHRVPISVITSSRRSISTQPIRKPWSFSTLFSRNKAGSTPPISTVAAVARLEADANAKPADVGRQLALFKALSETRTKAGFDLIIARWERMCEFDPTSPLLRSDDAFKLYLDALIKTDLAGSVDASVRRRDSLLAAHPLPAGSGFSETSSPATSTTSPVAVSSDSPASPPSQSQSASQQIAQSVITAASTSGSGAFSASAGGTQSFTLPTGAGASGNPIHVTLSQPKASWVPGIIRFVVITAVSSFFVLVVFAVLLENSGLLKAGPQQSQFEPTPGKTVRFSDVHGVDEAKTELQDVVQFLKDPTAFAGLGGRLPKGVLLTGPPGTGKTMLARAVAGEAGVPFLFASGSEFDEMFVGVGAKRVRELFAAARKKQPAIIFLDELDAIGGKRNARDQHYMKQTLNQLLVEMDGFQQAEGVIVIAATNFPESLDQALVRPGRFDRHIAVPLPDVKGRVQILQHHMRDVISSPDVDPTILARGTPGFSGADLQNMVNQAAIQAAKEGSRSVTAQHFEWAKDRIIMGAERKSHFIEEKDKLMTAYHEGGHALVALYTEGAMPLHKVTCVTRGHALGVTTQLPLNDRVSVTLKEYLAEIDVCMGGRVAEEMIYGRMGLTSGASSDIVQATRTASAMVKKWGFSEKVGPVFHDKEMSTAKQEEIEDEIKKLVTDGEHRVAALLKEKEVELHRLAHALVVHETLDSDEVKKVISGESIRNITEILEEAKQSVGDS